MGEFSAIAWTDGTANFWWGCMKVDQGCSHCYAETLSKRVGKSIWGPPATTDREVKKAVWTDILKWDRKAKAEGVRKKLFVQSMSDFLEDHPALIEPRKRAVGLLESLEATDVQLLTKRPENAQTFLGDWIKNGWPRHIWMGTSIAHQEDVHRVPVLMDITATILWLSVEPMIGPIVLQPFLSHISWVVVGGESGAGCRPFNAEWARSLLAECRLTGTAFFMKQLGGHPDKRHDPAGWPEDLRVREFPNT